MDTNTELTLVPRTIDGLEDMAYADLELIKSQLDTFRQRILALQNAQSPLVRLPGELRNKIFLFAMYGELLERKSTLSRHPHAKLYQQPAFFNVSRQIKAECTGVWFNDVLVWEEFDIAKGAWRGLDMEGVQSICAQRAANAKDLKIVTKLAHCDLGRTRDGVESSRSICSRKGLVRVDFGDGIGFPQLRWWVW